MIWINDKFMQEPEVRAYINELTAELEKFKKWNEELRTKQAALQEHLMNVRTEKPIYDINKITDILIEKIFRNEKIMFNSALDKISIEIDNQEYYLIDVIAALHNLLYEARTGERYDYMWHWANKIGSWCRDDCFDIEKEKD